MVMTMKNTDELAALIDAEIQHYLEMFRLHESDRHKYKDPITIERLMRIYDSWDSLPSWEKIVYSTVLPESPGMKVLMALEMAADPDPNVTLDNFNQYAV